MNDIDWSDLVVDRNILIKDESGSYYIWHRLSVEDLYQAFKARLTEESNG